MPILNTFNSLSINSLKATLISAVTGCPLYKLVSSDNVANGVIGWSVAISGDGNTAILGAPTNIQTTATTVMPGNCYIFVKIGSNWIQQQKISLTGTNHLGQSVDISYDGNTVIIGGYWNLGNGGAYVYVRTGTTWALQASLPTSGNGFGWDVCISADGNTICVAAPYTTINDIGIVTVFSRTGITWNQTQSITRGMDCEEFGAAISLSDDGSILAIGCKWATETLTPARTIGGAVFIYQKNGNVYSPGTILMPKLYNANLFGLQIKVSGDGKTISILGNEIIAPSTTVSTYCYVYSNAGGWQLQQKIISPAPVTNSTNGLISLSYDGNKMIIGSPLATPLDNNGVPITSLYGSGAVYQYSRTNSVWSEVGRLWPCDAAYGQNTGFSVDMSSDGSAILVGSPYNNINGTTYKGSAYIW